MFIFDIFCDTIYYREYYRKGVLVVFNKKKRNDDDYIIYIVQENDTLNSIANKYDVTVKSIIDINELEDENIVVGQQLYIKRSNDGIPIFLLLIMLVGLIAGASFITFAITDYFSNQGGGGSNNIDVGTVIFSFSESDNVIDIVDAYPLSDIAGKSQNGISQYFDFNVTFQFTEEANKVIYEVNLTEANVNRTKLDPKYVKVYLEENGGAANGFTDTIPLFSELQDSKYRQNTKVLYTKEITSTQTNSYRFRMWVAEGYKVDETVRTFKCLVNVDGYVE